MTMIKKVREVLNKNMKNLQSLNVEESRNIANMLEILENNQYLVTLEGKWRKETLALREKYGVPEIASADVKNEDGNYKVKQMLK